MAVKTERNTCSVESCDMEGSSIFSTMACDRTFEFASDVVSCGDSEAWSACRDICWLGTSDVFSGNLWDGNSLDGGSKFLSENRTLVSSAPSKRFFRNSSSSCIWVCRLKEFSQMNRSPHLEQLYLWQPIDYINQHIFCLIYALIKVQINQIKTQKENVTHNQGNKYTHVKHTPHYCLLTDWPRDVTVPVLSPSLHDAVKPNESN